MTDLKTYITLWCPELNPIQVSKLLEKFEELELGARVDEMQKHLHIMEDAPGDAMGWLDGILHLYQTKLYHAGLSMFMDVQVNESSAATIEAKKSLIQPFKDRITQLKKGNDDD